MTKKKAIYVLTLYFLEKGKIMGKREYKEQTDCPIRPALVGRYIGSWNRLPRMIERAHPEVYEEILNYKEPEVKEEIKLPKPKVKEEGPNG